MNVTLAHPPTAHCPLCIPGMVTPSHDLRPPAIIFLDMDGVMITGRFSDPLNSKIRSTLKALFPNTDHKGYHWTIAAGRHLNPVALNNLHALIERVESAGRRALVVISSGCRNDATTLQLREEAFQIHEFSKFIAGKTAQGRDDGGCTPECKMGHDFLTPAKAKYNLELKDRSEEIEHWLREHRFDPKTSNYVVIDDYDQGLGDRFGARFIQTCDLFQEQHLEAATNCLLKPLPTEEKLQDKSLPQ